MTPHRADHVRFWGRRGGGAASSPTTVTPADLAEAFSEVSGEPVAYRAVSSDDLGPAGFVHQLIASGLFSEPSDDLEKLLGRPVTSLRAAVESVWRPSVVE